MSDSAFDAASTAVLIVDLQNDFLHPEGAYGRSGTSSPEIAALPSRIRPLLDTVRQAGGWVVSTQFSLIPGRGGAPFISSHLQTLRPFLTTGDFVPGGWGHSLVDELQPTDLIVEKVLIQHFTRRGWSLFSAVPASRP
jgi:nicotinamidase-related amidase